ncbi:shikimate kinase [Lysobacter sp. GX 14042]|uniref:shikimate kinase n=1 Tax=Lysobacter sp. GX 14042 TaxID=2907155 RepID=UPI001F3A05AA|nr:shikimate kinase [Lysobacter sp. GX 14042]MCE7031886.1 shikimate kinase [Lysobacter sp. GX 14042]
MPKPAPNLALVGPMGAGKSTVATLLAPLLGLRAVDTDAEIERGAGMPVAEVFRRHGEAGFRRMERETLARLLGAAGQLLATGGGAVLDPATRDLLRRRAFVIHLHAGAGEQLARLHGDVGRPLLQCPDPAARLRELAAVRDPLYAAVAGLRIDTNGLSPRQVADRLHATLEGAWRPGETA